MKMLQIVTLMLLSTLSVLAQTPKPIWELGKNPIDPKTAKGKVELVDDVIKFDGTNSFEIPADVIGKRKNFTIEFEFSTSEGFEVLPRMLGALRIINNTDMEKHTGINITYLPPKWDPNGGVSNRIGLAVNSYWNEEMQGLSGKAVSGKGFDKFTLIVKDSMPSIYKNGLLIAMLGELKASDKPLTIGGWGYRGLVIPAKYKDQKALAHPYRMRNLKIFDTAITPTGYDSSTNMMRSVSGDGYKMHCALVKDKSLPRILVIGDSISMGYRKFITEHFKGKAYVDYWVGRGVPWGGKQKLSEDSKSIRAWKGVLSNGPYDVVSWNPMTLHWWHRKLLNRCPDEKFLAQALTDTVKILKKIAPDTQFIWIRCTPIRKCLDDGTHVLDDAPNCNTRIIRYNKVADEVMKKEGIPEVDLYGIAVKQLHTVRKGSKDIVHWNGDVSRLFAQAISKEIEKYLPKKK